QKVITDDPQNIQAQMALAYSLRSSGKPEAAVKIYQHLMEKEDSVVGLQNYARVLIRYNRKEELLSSLSRMKAQGKFTDRHDEVLGEIYLNLNQLAEAR